MTTDELYRYWHDRMVAYFARNCHGYEAEDLTQELFVRYLQTLCKGRPIHAPERWLWRAARNLIIDRYRHYGRQLVLVDAELSDLEIEDPRQPDPLEWVCCQDRAVAASALLPELTAEQGGVVALRYAGDLGYRDVACRLGISLTAAKARHHRALARLRVVARATVEGSLDSPT